MQLNPIYNKRKKGKMSSAEEKLLKEQSELQKELDYLKEQGKRAKREYGKFTTPWLKIMADSTEKYNKLRKVEDAIRKVSGRKKLKDIGFTSREVMRLDTELEKKTEELKEMKEKLAEISNLERIYLASAGEARKKYGWDTPQYNEVSAKLDRVINARLKMDEEYSDMASKYRSLYEKRNDMKHLLKSYENDDSMDEDDGEDDE